jgi:branched-chain amino acid transport system substrate-binding protein
VTKIAHGTIVITVVAAALALAACGSSGSNDALTSSATNVGLSTTANASVSLGAPKPASGSPITLGMISMEGGSAGSYPQLRQAAQAAVMYVNEYKGGVHGHPLKLDVCVSDGTPPSSETCARQLIQAKPVAIAGSADFGSSASLPLYQKAGLAYIGGAPVGAPEMTNPNSVQFTGFAVGVFPALAVYAADKLHAKTAALLYYDIPPAQNAMENNLVPVLNAKGIHIVKKVPVPVSSPDFSAVIAAATSGQPDVLIALIDGRGCTAAMQSMQSLGANVKLLAPGACADASVVKAAGAAANNAYASNNFLTEPDNAQVAAYNGAIAKYAPKDITKDEFAQAGFNTIMNIWQQFNELPANGLTTQSILKKFRAGADQPNFMAHPFTCDGQQVPGAPAICNAAQRILQIQSGKVTPADNNWYDGTQYLKH